MAEQLKGLEDQLRKYAEGKVDAVLKNAREAVARELYNHWYENVFDIKTQAALDSATKKVIDTLAGDLVTKQELSDIVFERLVRKLVSKASAV
jgi:hypothetical protein